MHLDHVPRRPRERRHDRHLPLGDAIEQRRLAGVRRPGNRHHQAVAQPLAPARARQRFGDLVAEFARNRQRRPDQILRHVRLVGKIDARLDQRQRLDQPRPPGLDAITEQALELGVGLTALRLGLGTDQIGEPLHRGEVEPAVLESAARELTRLRRPQSFDPAERAEHRGNHRAAAVQLQLGDVFAGLAVRAGKPQRQRLVDHFAAVRIAHAGEGGLARLRQLSGQRLQCVAGARTGHADHRNRRRRAARGEGEDGIAGEGGHRAHGSAGGNVGSRPDWHWPVAAVTMPVPVGRA